MPSNIEIKARVRDPEGFRRTAEALADRQEMLRQDDTFFVCPHGRLKLRRFADGAGELIHYERADVAGPKTSHYRLVRIPDPQGLALALGDALGVAGVVRKVRRVFLAGQTRIHLDEVEGLGAFAELEVVLREGQTPAEGTAIARDLMARLGIREEDLVEGAYLDLLARPSPAAMD